MQYSVKLQCEIIFSFQRYQAHLETQKEGSGDYLCGTVEVLKNTAVLVRIFCGPESLVPIASKRDKRLAEIKEVADFFSNWEEQAKHTAKSYASKLFSYQCREDLQSSLLGFLELVDHQ